MTKSVEVETPICIPGVFVDRYLRTLSRAEVKVFLCLTKYPFGLTHDQIEELTGLGIDPVKTATKGLTILGFIKPDGIRSIAYPDFTRVNLDALTKRDKQRAAMLATERAVNAKAGRR